MRVGKSGAKFDPEKSKWFNQQHLRLKSNAELTQLVKKYIEFDVSDSYLEKVIELMKERATFISDLLSERYFFESVSDYSQKTFQKKWKANTLQLVNEFFTLIDQDDVFTVSSTESIFQKFISSKQIGMGAILPNLRLILTGKGMGPSLFEIIALLGKKEVMKRHQERSIFFEKLYLENSNN